MSAMQLVAKRVPRSVHRVNSMYPTVQKREFWSEAFIFTLAGTYCCISCSEIKDRLQEKKRQREKEKQREVKQQKDEEVKKSITSCSCCMCSKCVLTRRCKQRNMGQKQQETKE